MTTVVAPTQTPVTANASIVDGSGRLTQYGMLVFSSLLARVSTLEQAMTKVAT